MNNSLHRRPIGLGGRLNAGLVALMATGIAAAPAAAQTAPDWNRRVTGIMIESGAVGGGFDVTAEWRIDLEGSSSVPVELGSVVDFMLNSTTQSSNTHEDCVIWDIMDSGGGTHDCPNQTDGTVCGTATIGTTNVDLTCDSETGTCSTPPFLSTFPGVLPAVKDDIEILLRPAAGAQSDGDTDDDSGQLTFGSWNRKLIDVNITLAVGAGPGLYDVSADIQLETTAGSTVPLNLGIDTEPVTDPSCCLEACCCPSCSSECGGNGCGDPWDYVLWRNHGSFGACAAPSCDVTCADGRGGGTGFDVTCDSTDCVCRSEVLTLLWPAIPLTPGDEIMVLLRPAPGALPELPPVGGDDDDSIIVGVPTAVPAVSEWGVLAMGLLLATSASIAWRRVNA